MRTTLSRLAATPKATATLAGIVLLALVLTTLGYFQLSNSVTLTLDGKQTQVRTFGDTVGDVLDAEGIEVTPRDVVVPSPESELVDDAEVSVRFARPIDLNVDGEKDTLWTTATTVEAALVDLDVRHQGARLSASRSASIDREGMSLTVATPKTITVKVANAKPVKRTVPALNAKDALRQLDIKFDDNDQVKPADRVLRDGDKVVLNRIRVAVKDVKREQVPFRTVERDDDSMYEGETEVDREGADGLRNVTYQIVWKNGEEVRRNVVRQKVLRKPVAQVERVGTKELAANFAGGNGPFDRIAQCESGGNWSINTGNGYYGGLQFSLSTWRAYGGPGMPHQQSRETQIAVAKRLVAAEGGYGAWPHCGKLA